MKDDLKDILSNLNPGIDQETLLLYLQGKLSEEKHHELEKQILRDDFDSDALEGLEGMQDRKNVQVIVDQLNQELRKKTIKKKRSKLQELNIQPWIIISLIIILLLIVISYVIIFMYMKEQ
ncbi:MAG: hypothetical protein H0U44_02250 [Flavisolibacter sp.]|jgi:hypothetical protein|nr:hypothetical protein [Flavisolibacter sp.]